MDEIELWPLGGLEEPYGRGYWQDHLQTMLAGLVTNLLIALSCLLVLPTADALLLLSPAADMSVVADDLFTTVCRMAFVINATLFAVNLIPVTPFDGGVLLRTYLTSRFAEIEGRDLMVRLGLIFGLLGMLTGFVLNFSSLVAVSAFVLVLHLHENMRWYESIDQRDEFSDYDFFEEGGNNFGSSFGTREDADRDDEDAVSHAEILDRWRSQREQEEQEERRREEEQVDRILEKLHIHGREALSHHDLHLLNRVSHRYRDGKQHH